MCGVENLLFLLFFFHFFFKSFFILLLLNGSSLLEYMTSVCPIFDRLKAFKATCYRCVSLFQELDHDMIYYLN